jgi:hypothetical protein
MHFRELETYRRKYRSIAARLDEFDAYLSERLHLAPDNGLVPIQVAKKLNVDEGLALSLMGLAHNAGLLKPCYFVYCSEVDAFLAKYPSLKSIPKYVFCPFHGREHSLGEYEVELTFLFTDVALKQAVA